VNTPEAGEIIGGYRFEQMIAAGSVGRVYVATHTKLHRRAAIKIVNLEAADDPNLLDRLINEARVVNSIRHPAIVDISDIIEVDAPRRIALIMEHIQGPSLKTVIEQTKPLPFEHTLAVIVQLAEALEAAHAAGVVHRDIKPANLLLTADPSANPHRAPRLKIVDFGIAKLRGSSAITAAGIIIGTPAYMAPEQITSAHPASPATDVYAVAEVFWELLTGRRVFPRIGLTELVKMKARGEIPELPLPNLPGAVSLRRFVQQALARSPGDRPRLAELRELILAICPEARTKHAWPRRPSSRPPQPPVQTNRQPTEEEKTEMTVYEATLEMLIPPSRKT
jgi:eukaryotic-like serine/threonine-protein kinase